MRPKIAHFRVAAVVLGLGAGLPLPGHDVITTKITWSREISRVFFKRCVSCHRDGGSAFDLTTYEKARPWAEAIKEEVLERRMPPWGAIKGFGDFRNDAGLTQEEIELISQWVVGGAPAGDESLLPADPPPDPAPASSSSRTRQTLALSGDVTLKRKIVISSIRPENLPEKASVQIFAERPDAAVEPLIWIYNYAARFKQTYEFRTPRRLPAGTRIRMAPATGTVALLLEH